MNGLPNNQTSLNRLFQQTTEPSVKFGSKKDDKPTSKSSILDLLPAKEAAVKTPVKSPAIKAKTSLKEVKPLEQPENDTLEIGIKKTVDSTKINAFENKKESKASQKKAKQPPVDSDNTRSSLKENLKVFMALNFNLIIPIASSFLWALGPIGLIGIPVSYYSGKIGRKLMKSVDQGNTSQAAGNIKTLSEMVHDTEEKRTETLEKLKSEGKITDTMTEAEVTDTVNKAQANVVDTAVDEVIDSILNIKHIPLLTPLMTALLKGRMSPYIKGYFKSQAKQGGKGQKIFMWGSIYKDIAKAENPILATKNAIKAAFDHFIYFRLDDALLGLGQGVPGFPGMVLKGLGWALRIGLPLLGLNNTRKAAKEFV